MNYTDMHFQISKLNQGANNFHVMLLNHKFANTTSYLVKI